MLAMLAKSQGSWRRGHAGLRLLWLRRETKGGALSGRGNMSKASKPK